MPKPETNLWNLLRQRLKDKGYFFTRIENRSGGGIPDTYIVKDGLCFWVELKVSNGNKVNMSPHQIAWHTSHSLNGGKSFILVKHLSSSILFLFEGSKVRELSRVGLETRSMVQGSWNEIFDTFEHKI